MAATKKDKKAEAPTEPKAAPSSYAEATEKPDPSTIAQVEKT
jgi:hypothetical protein